MNVLQLKGTMLMDKVEFIEKAVFFLVWRENIFSSILIIEKRQDELNFFCFAIISQKFTVLMNVLFKESCHRVC